MGFVNDKKNIDQHQLAWRVKNLKTWFVMFAFNMNQKDEWLSPYRVNSQLLQSA